MAGKRHSAGILKRPFCFYTFRKYSCDLALWVKAWEPVEEYVGKWL